MQVSLKNTSDTEAVLTIIPNSEELTKVKEHVLEHLASSVKLPGFRSGKAPLALVEKNVDQAALQSDFLEEAIGQMYQQAIAEQKLRVVERPQITLLKFVPFNTLEFQAAVPIISKITLPDYKKITQSTTKVTVTAKEVKEVLESLAQRQAERKEIDRAAKNGDEVTIDFKGVDAKKQPIKGADGQSYPLVLGSKTFIPGFEEHLVGLKKGDKKDFTLTFPKDYGVKALANKKVTFSVTVQKIQELVEPQIDDAFAAKVGPFKDLAELKEDITKQLTTERQTEAERNDESELVRKITAKSKVSIPQVLIDSTVENLLRDLKQNLVYRGQTFQEFLELEDKTEEDYKKELEPQAEERVKASIVLAEIADKEKLDVSLEELEVRIQALKGQYQDAAMQAELDKPENRENIASRILTEKVIAKLKELCFTS